MKNKVFILSCSNFLLSLGLKSIVLELQPSVSVFVVHDLNSCLFSDDSVVFSFEPSCDNRVVVVDTSASESQLRSFVAQSLSSASCCSDEDKTTKPLLTNREIQVLRCVSNGMINKEIAAHLNISLQTVLSHRKNISSKLGIKTISGLTVYALMNGLK